MPSVALFPVFVSNVAVVVVLFFLVSCITAAIFMITIFLVVDAVALFGAVFLCCC